MRRRVAIAALTGVAALALAGCSAAPGARVSAAPRPAELRVSAATSLKPAFTELAAVFEAREGAEVALNCGASGVLAAQVKAGAPCDVFASAAPEQVDSLIAAGLVSAEDTATFAGNEIVVIVPAGNPAGIASLDGLGKAERLTTGNPDTAPHGTAAFEVLSSLGSLEALRPRFVFAENAAQTLDYVARGEVDAGLVFASEASGRRDVEVAATADPSTHAPIRHVAAIIRGDGQRRLPRAWLDLLASPDGRAVLARHGFLPSSTAPAR